MTKRKRDIEVQSVGSSVTTLTFKGVNAPEDAKFEVYSKKSTGDIKVHGETEKFEYDGSNEADCEYCVAAYNPETNSVELFPASLINMTSTIKAKKNIEGPAVKQANVRGAIQKTALGEAFGTKKAKKAITDQERNKIEADKLQDFEAAIMDNVKTATDSLPSQQERLSQLQSDRPIPPYNVETHKVDEIYPLEGIIPHREYASIRVGPIVKEKTVDKRIALLPHKTSQIIQRRLQLLEPKPGDHTDIMKQIYYAALLLCVYENKRVNNKQTLLAKLGNPPDILVSGILDRFAVSKAGQFGKTKERNFTIDPIHENKLLCYLLTLLLRIDNYILEINSLARELSLKPSKLVELLRAMGCNVKNASQTQAEALGIAKSQASSTKVAVLTAPLNLPDLTKRKRR